MVSKDQSIGGIILVVCVIVALFYTVTLFYPDWMINMGWASEKGDVQFWLIAVPVFIAFIAIMAIGAWIGLTMATTPPPKPIEEITKEMEKAEEKVEEKPEEKPAAETVEEEKKTERRRKS
jgi:formate hydrogenlyase subunit 3/multisubunit Na+/H+ antiporter MnhD subunit